MKTIVSIESLHNYALYLTMYLRVISKLLCHESDNKYVNISDNKYVNENPANSLLKELYRKRYEMTH